MDPNANLKELLELAASLYDQFEDYHHATRSSADPDDPGIASAFRIAELFQALDEWICKQGFLPERWQLAQDRKTDQYFRETLEERFPWLADPNTEDVSGADTIQDLAELYRELPHRPTITTRETHVLASGNPFDGLHLHGPFPSAAAANDYADNHFSDSDWWVCSLTPADLDLPEPSDPAVAAGPDELIRNLWHFVENTRDDDPDRTDKFFDLRARVRNHFHA